MGYSSNEDNHKSALFSLVSPVIRLSTGYVLLVYDLLTSGFFALLLKVDAFG